ncbi:MAG TPA: sulfite exporter TauE/SafE family protein [Acetobacteraceae bacterium]|jgi:hypothetical protein
MQHVILLAAAGLSAGAMNAVAGGGSFVSFPAMVAAGLPPVIANASSTVALFPGTLASTLAYRHDFVHVRGLPLRAMVPVTVAGGLVGAVLLLATPERLFDAVIPFLLLLATLTFAFGARAGLAFGRLVRVGPRGMPAVQFVISIYGGYFGGAVGLMMMAAWSLLTANADLKAMAPIRVLLVSVANGAAVLWFIGTGSVRWPQTLAMLGASVVGGYLGARLAQVLPAAMLRVGIVILTAGVTIGFFLRALR